MSISIHTKMFAKVCKTFLKSLSFYSVLIISFGLCFYNLQGDKFLNDNQKSSEMKARKDESTKDESTDDETIAYVLPSVAVRSDRFNNFYTVGSSIIKSFVMLTGELE